MSDNTYEKVKDYYGKVLETKNDLKTTACCSSTAYPEHVKDIVSQIPGEVLEKCYGCGIPIPTALEGLSVLDLGCGAGRDAFILSKLVGATGKVIGVDMTEEQLATARKYQPEVAKEFGFDNIEFVQGYMENLEAAGIENDCIDLVISNCVFNLSPEKEQLYKEIFRVLKPGGELYFSDVFVDRRLPKEHQTDAVLLGECLGGAMYIQDFRRVLRKLGVEDYREVGQSPISITNAAVKEKTGEAQFSSITIRAFKLDLEDQCEDYGQAAVYNGGIPGSEHSFELDDHHLFEKGRLMSVCSNTAAMVKDTRFGKYFTIYGEGKTHYGLFPCGPIELSSGIDSSCC